MHLNRKQWIIAAGLMALGLACTVKDPLTLSESAPILSRGTVFTPLFLGSDLDYGISVSADDANGFKDIAHVRWEIVVGGSDVSVSQGNLLDNGSTPDLVAGDGRFSAALSLDDVNRQAGHYRLIFQAEDQGGRLSDTLGVALTVLDSTLDQPVFLRVLLMPDTLHPGEQGLFSVSANNSEGNASIDSVWADLYAPYSVAADVHLRLNTSELPGTYAIPWEAVSVGGMWTARFQAVDAAGSLSLPVIETFYIKTAEGPPEIISVTTPDTVSRSSTEPFLLAVTVSDPAGLADIEAVYFNTTKPDGTPSGGNPFTMVDDGTQGDVTGGDGIYSLEIAITSASALGNYSFEFIARDRGGLISAPETRIIVVVE